MKKSNQPSNPNRRKFLKGVGSSIAGVYLASPALETKAKNISNEILDSYEGKIDLNLTVNGKKYSQKIDPTKTLAEFIRDDLNLTGTKIVCNQGECGSCTVLLNGDAVYSCHMLALDADGGEIITVEGLEGNNHLHPIQESFIEEDGLQCGFCTPGQIMSAYALLNNNPNPTDNEIKHGMSGNLCRCGAYPKIFDSVKAAIEK